MEKIIRSRDIPAVTGYCISRIYQLIREGKFPKPIPLGARAVGWRQSEIAAWQATRVAARDAASPERKAA